MDGLRNHGPLGLDMLKAPPPLRCETAPLAVVSAVMTLTGNLE